MVLPGPARQARQAGPTKERLRNNFPISFPPHLDPLPRYSLRGGGEETNEEVISEPFLSMGVPETERKRGQESKVQSTRRAVPAFDSCPLCAANPKIKR